MEKGGLKVENYSFIFNFQSTILLVSKNLQHALVALFLAEDIRKIFAGFVALNDDVLRRRNQAVLDSAVAAQTFLVSTRMEEPDI